ncbi:MAG: hypothetical protein HQL74_07505 [Magnetococcales bacterium]|nr:hypothetical protein [Magnetococcales bacterium]
MFSVKFDDSALNKAFAKIEKQMQFAASMALTETAKAIQAEVRQELPKKFTIRTGWIAKGIQVKAATKSNLVAKVVVKDEFMALQEEGGMKQSITGKALGVPIGARPNPLSTTRPSMFPGALLKKTGYFIAPITGKSLTARSEGKNGYNRRRRMNTTLITADHVGKMALWHRRGKKSLPIDLIYIFESAVKITPRFGFREMAYKKAMEEGPKQFAKAFQKAMETAR